jgi:hypothetical protein
VKRSKADCMKPVLEDQIRGYGGLLKYPDSPEPRVSYHSLEIDTSLIRYNMSICGLGGGWVEGGL